MQSPPDPLHSALRHVLEQHAPLDREQARALLDHLLDTALAPAGLTPQHEHRTAALLGALAARGETAPELAGFVDALRARSTPIPVDDALRARLVDTCGTGGDLSGTFNISTAAALVAAAAGVPVAKHGNRAVTSRSGSADVLEALGIPVDLAPAVAAQALATHGFAFLPAPLLQPAMRALLPLRRSLGVRTAFNILGPMTNPARAQAQVIGVYSPHLVPIVAETLVLLGTRHALVVHGTAVHGTAVHEAAVHGSEDPPGTAHGIDEFSLAGPTHLAEVRGNTVTFSTLIPADFGLTPAPLSALAGGDAQANAQILRSIFAGEPGPRPNPQHDIVVINAAAVLIVAGLAPDFPSAIALAARTLDSGAVTALVAALAQPA